MTDQKPASVPTIVLTPAERLDLARLGTGQVEQIIPTVEQIIAGRVASLLAQLEAATIWERSRAEQLRTLQDQLAQTTAELDTLRNRGTSDE